MAVNPDRIAAAQSKLSEDPHDTDSWVLLIKHAQCRSVPAVIAAQALGYHLYFFMLTEVWTRPERRTRDWWRSSRPVADTGNYISSRR